MELGLDSLQTIALKHGVDAVLGIELPLAILLAEKNLSVLAKEISALPPTDHLPVSSGTTGLSYTQRALWAVHRLDQNSISCNLHLALDIAGELDTQRLRTALAHILERHEQLRTVYQNESDVLGQTAEPLAKLTEWFSLVDVSGWDAAPLQADIGLRVRQPFDLERGPPLRVVAYRSAPAKCTLLFCAHHIAVDFWSLLLVVQELDEYYRDHQSRRVSEALPSPRYADFVVWQQNYLESSLAAHDFEYWRGQLDRSLPILELPVDFPRPSVPDYSGASKALHLSTDLTAALKALATRKGISLFTLLLAAYQALLHRYSGQDEIVVGVPGSGRLEGGFARLVGNCVNPIAIVGRPHPNLPFVEFLRQLGEQVRNALVHQNFPFPILVERLHPQRQGDQWPIYQTSFVLQQAQPELPPNMALLALGEDSEPFSWCGCEATIRPLQNRVENFDLKVMAVVSDGGLILSFQYRTDLFLPATIARMAEHFSALLAGIVASPEARISELPLLTEVERHNLLVKWNATASDYRRDACVHELFVAQAGLRPGAVAVSFGDQRLTYAELDERTNRLAHYLHGRGVGPDVLVGLCVERSLDMVVGVLGILKAGGAYLPLDPDYPEERLAYMVADAEPRLLLTQAHLVPLLPERVNLFCLDKDWEEVAGTSTRNPVNGTLPLNLAYVIYTSGSSGRPKGVAVTHGGLVNRLEWMVTYFGVGETDAILQKTPYGFDVSVWEFFLPLLAGGRLIIARPGDHQDPPRLMEIIERERVTTVHFVPSMLQAFLDAPDLSALSTLRRVICSGEALSSRLRDQFYAGQPAKLYNLYGPTEASIDVTAHACDQDGEDKSVPIGRPIWNTQIYLLDRKFNPVPVGVVGELYIGGIGLARGYLGRPGLTGERFVPDPFGEEGGRLYRTGDLARWRTDGTLDYLGRIDHQVKLRGFRIELGEIEARLLERPAVRAAVVTMREAGANKQLVAYIVGLPGGPLNSEALLGWLRRSLPDYMVPSRIVWLDELPLTPNGKIDRNALPAPDARGETADYVPPQTREEELLAGIWKDVLDLERVGVTDNFFALGGDSILSIQVASRVRGAGFDLTPRLVFLHPTLGALASLMRPIITAACEPSAPPPAHFALAELPPRQVEKLRNEFAGLVDLYPLTPMQEGMLFHCLLLPGSGIYVLQDQYEIRGMLNIDAFRDAWQQVIDRHDILRSAMLWRQIAKPHQRVQSRALLPFFFEDYRGLASAEQERRLAEVLEVERRDGIDLEMPPLMRIRLIRLGEDRWRCVRSHHHILTDEWCTSPLFVEFRNAYAALVKGHPFPECRVYQFRDYLAWLRYQDLAVPEAFWRSYLKGFREPTPLVVDRSRRARHTMPGEVLDAQGALDRGPTLALQQVAQKYGLTPNTLIQAAWALLLGRYASCSEVVFGITVSGRPAELPGIEQMLGLFINTLPLRLQLRDKQRVCDWWREIQSVNLDLRQFEFTPLVLCQTWSEVPAGVDLFQYLLVYENAPVDPSLLSDRSVLDMRFIGHRVHTNYPITATVIPGDKLHVRITYQADRFEQASVQRLLIHFLALLEAMVARPQGRLGDFGLLLPAERRQQLQHWNETAQAYAQPADFVAAFEARVELCPDAPAVRCGEVSISYCELNRRVNKVAHCLIARGVGPEIIVGVIDERGVDFLVMMLAVLKADGVLSPLGSPSSQTSPS